MGIIIFIISIFIYSFFLPLIGFIWDLIDRWEEDCVKACEERRRREEQERQQERERWEHERREAERRRQQERERREQERREAERRRQQEQERWEQERREQEQREAERRQQEKRKLEAERKWKKWEEERALKKQEEERARQEEKKLLLLKLRRNLLPLKEMDVVLVDTCCLMREGESANLFFENLASIGVKLTVIEDVYGELNRHKADETDASRQYGARLALKRIEDMLDRGCCTINPFLPNRTFYADDKFIEMTTTFCKGGKKVIIVTEDRDLRIKIKSRLESIYSPEQVRKTVVKIDDFFN